MDDAKVDLERNLEVVPKNGNSLIAVSMSTRVPRDAMVIVKAAIKAHVAGRTEMLHDMQLKQMETLDRSINGYNDLINTYEVDMKAHQAQLSKYLANSNGTARVVWKRSSPMFPLLGRIAQLCRFGDGDQPIRELF